MRNKNTSRPYLVTLLTAVAITSVVATACSADPGSTNDDHGRGDAGIASRDYGKSHVVNQPDGYANVSMKCDGKYGYMIVVVTHSMSDTSPQVFPDPRCPGWRKDLTGPGQPATSGGPAPAEDE